MPVNALGIDVGRGGPSGAGWSEISSFMRCPKEYQYATIRGVRPVGSPASPRALGVGTLVHAGRAVFFGNGCLSDSGVVTEMDREFADSQTSTRPLEEYQLREAKVIVEQYIAYWMKQAKPKSLAVEYLLGPSPVFEGDLETARTSRLDDISYYPEAGNKLCIGDLKTTSGSINSVVQEYTMHGQPLLNMLLYKQVAEGEARFGRAPFWLVDVVKKPDNSNLCKFERVALPITEYMVQNYRESMTRWLRAKAMMTRDGEAPRNYTQCAKAFGRGEKAGARACDFRDLCMWGVARAKNFINKEGQFLDETEDWK